MKIEIDTNEDSYEIWKKAQELIEYTYQSTPKQMWKKNESKKGIRQR